MIVILPEMAGKWFRITLLSVALCFCAGAADSVANPYLRMKCDAKFNPVGVDADKVSFSLVLNPVDGVQPEFYRISVASSEDRLDEGDYDMWDSGKTKGTTVLIPYEGKELIHGRKYFWKIKVWDDCGKEYPWSEPAFFVTALENEDFSVCEWIGYENLPEESKVVPGIHVQENPDGTEIGKDAVVPYFRKTFNTGSDIAEAYMSVCGLGQYETYVNGVKVSPFLSPGWSDYGSQVLFNTYDVTALLEGGAKNVISAIAGPGFWYISSHRYHKFMVANGYPMLICRLDIRYSDGSQQRIVTDGTWKTAPSPVTFSSIYGGEDFDARLYDASWNEPDFDDSGWKDAVICDAPQGRLEPETSLPQRVLSEISPVNVAQIDDSTWTWDFGQNASGIISVTLAGNRGDRVRFYPGELLHEDGRVNQKASGSPYYYEYILGGTGEETWQPKFTYYGFRYVTVTGARPVSDNPDGNYPEITDIRLLHTCNSSEKVGEFKCSSELMNDIYSLIDWAIRSNMQSVMTDCPHREKLGWLEQSYLMGNSIRYNYDIYLLYRKMTRDMMASQRDNGLVPDIAPEYVTFSGGFLDSPEWGAACIAVPYSLYRWYGDREILEEAYPMMKRYVGYLSSKADGFILSHGLGDWFDYGPDAPGEAQLTPVALTATATYYYCVSQLAEIASLLGFKEDAGSWSRLAEDIFTAFNDRFYDPDRKIYATGSQTSLAMPLCLGLVPGHDRKAVRRVLLEKIEDDGCALTAGDIGFHYLVEALSEDMQSSEVLYRMINRTDVPGYGFQIAKGATALTESWPALEVVSNNHLMLGHVMEWFYTSVLGIREAEGSIAFDRIILKPMPVGDLEWAEGSCFSPRGKIEVEWRKTSSGLEFKCSIPPGSEAEIIVPDGYTALSPLSTLRSGKHGLFFGKADDSPAMEIRSMTCEYLPSPTCLDVKVPRFSWKYSTSDMTAYGQAQSAYRIMVSADSTFSDESMLMWDSGWRQSSSSLLIAYEGKGLLSDRTYFWKVEAKDESGRSTGWSETSEWKTGLFSQDEWTASWIGCDELYDTENPDECNIWDPWFRKTFSLTEVPAQANLFIASIGYHEVYVNGFRVHDDVLAPAVTDHSVRARYVSYDLRPWLVQGENIISVWLGTSWSVFPPYMAGRKPLTPVFIAQADIYYDKPCGNPEPELRIVSDSSWLTHPSPNRLLGSWSMRNMGGELWDARREIPDWNLLSCDESSWTEATVYDVDLKISAYNGYPTRVFEEITPKRIERMEDGSYKVDMGVNFAGWVQANVKGRPGTRIDFEFSEREYESMTFNNHSAYIVGESGEGVFRNRFNYGSGRWITVRGLSEEPQLSDFRGWTLRTAYPVLSSFECSDSLQNWINDRVLWTLRNLSIGGYVVDCPQRERLGYGGDAHATSETALWNYDMGAFYTKWMQDWRDAQGRESNIGPRVGGGVLPHTAPTNDGGGGPAWGGITVMLPWFMYRYYGDERILEENYDMISRWLEFLESHVQDGILRRFGGPWDFLADWLWPGATAEGMNNDKPEAECFNSCYYALNLSTAAAIADVLGLKKDCRKWTAMAERTRRAVHRTFYDKEDSSYCDGSMSNLTVALLADVPPTGCRQAVSERLENMILKDCSGHIDVGITGGAMLFMLLRAEGRDDLLWSMTSQTDYPGWGYMKASGATTIWEMWEKDLPGHSLLHSSFLFPGAWYMSGIGGIRMSDDSQGFRHFILRAPDLPQLDSAEVSYDSFSGLIESEWSRNDGLLRYNVTVPPNTSATVMIPAREDVVVNERSGHAEYLGIADGCHCYAASSGYYGFIEVRPTD